MVDPVSAQIIPFPVRPQAELKSPDRLSTALGALSTALAEQQDAIQRWRQAMDDLAGCMRTLSGGLDRLSPPDRHVP